MNLKDIKKIDTDFTDFVVGKKERIKSSQYEALRSVNSEKLQTLSREIAWTHNVTIFQKSKDDEKLQPLVREIGKFEPEYAGKMSFYLSVLNDTIKLPDENASIGIIICKEKNRTTVEYALKDSNQPIGVGTYKLSSTLPKDIEGYLPSSEEIAARLMGVFDGDYVE